MTDILWAWALGAAGFAGVLVLVVVAIRQIASRYREDSVAKVVWIVVVVIYPIGGAAAWFLWESWLREAVRSRDRQSVRR